MNTTPSNIPENISNAEAIQAADILTWGTSFVQDNTGGNTAKILDFSSRFLAKRTTIILSPPVVLPKNTSLIKTSDPLPESIINELPNILEYIFSKTEDTNLIDSKIMKNLQSMMQVAADVDARAGRFGTFGVDYNASFSDTFKKALRPGLRKLIPENEQLLGNVNVNLTAIFNNTIQDKLLTAYGEVIKNKNTYESTDMFEQRLEAIKWFKKSWKVWGLDWAIPDESRKPKGGRNAFSIVEWTIPQKFENVLSLLLETFIESYVERVWETEAAMRHAPAEVAKSA